MALFSVHDPQDPGSGKENIHIAQCQEGDRCQRTQKNPSRDSIHSSQNSPLKSTCHRKVSQISAAGTISSIHGRSTLIPPATARSYTEKTVQKMHLSCFSNTCSRRDRVNSSGSLPPFYRDSRNGMDLPCPVLPCKKNASGWVVRKYPLRTSFQRSGTCKVHNQRKLHPRYPACKQPSCIFM